MLASSSRRLLLSKPAVASLARNMSALNAFTEEERMLKDSVKKWAEAEVKPLVRKMDSEKKMVSFWNERVVERIRAQLTNFI